MALQNDDDGLKRKSRKSLLLIITAIVPVWATVLFVGWFVISSLVPILDKSETSVMAQDKPDPFVLNFDTAAGKSEKTK
ncbi:MAG: hypothetical protein WD407_03535 [Rhodospirillales bacterium]